MTEIYKLFPYDLARCSIFVILMMLFFSCSTAKKIPGSYMTKFGSGGFFITFLDLKLDSSFFYQFSGDLINRKGVGFYSLEGRNIKLRYIPSKYDTLILGMRDDTVWIADRTHFRIEAVGIPIRVYDTLQVESRPLNFYYKNSKLFGISPRGKIIKDKEFVFSPRRRYFLFGTQYFNRRNPLRKTKRARILQIA